MATTQTGTNIPLNLNPGLQPLDMMTTSSAFAQFGFGSPIAADPATVSPNTAGPNLTTATMPRVSYLWYLLGIFILLVVMKFAGEHEKSGMQVHLAGVGVWNFVVITVMAMLGIATFKIVANKYPVRGLTDIVNMV